ncbi:gamma-glutamyl-gamma-aminobutyrate hydrolase family protein [Microbacterium sp. GXF7504]
MTGRLTALLLHPREERPHAPRFQGLLDRLTRSAADAVAAAGYDVSVVATAGLGTDAVLGAARRSDVVVLLGGEDVDPALYGGVAGYPGGGMHETEADRVAIAVIRDAVERGAPLLGICRGHQLLNVALGGTLVPDMHGHRVDGDDPFVPTVLSASDPLVDDVLAAAPALCAHHQAVELLGDGLEVLARAADGTIEAIVHRDAPVLGVQWHPEHPDTATAQLPLLLAGLRSPRTAPVV